MCQILLSTGIQARLQHSSCHSSWPRGTDRQINSLSQGRKEINLGGPHRPQSGCEGFLEEVSFKFGLEGRNVNKFLQISFLRSFAKNRRASLREMIRDKVVEGVNGTERMTGTPGCLFPGPVCLTSPGPITLGPKCRDQPFGQHGPIGSL